MKRVGVLYVEFVGLLQLFDCFRFFKNHFDETCLVKHVKEIDGKLCRINKKCRLQPTLFVEICRLRPTPFAEKCRLQPTLLVEMAECHNSQSVSLLSDSGLHLSHSDAPSRVKPKCLFWHTLILGGGASFVQCLQQCFDGVAWFVVLFQQRDEA